MTSRAAIAIAGLVLLALPLPSGGVLVVSVVGMVALAYTVARPGSAGAAVVIAAGVLSWLATPATHAHTARLLALAVAISVLHSLSALAAVVPGRAQVPNRLLLRWAGWGVVAATVGAGVLGAASRLPGEHTAAAVTALAVVAAALGGVALVALAHTPRRSPR